MHDEIELEEVQDGDFLALVLAFARGKHDNDIGAVKAYRLATGPGWKVLYDYYPTRSLEYNFEVSPEQLYGWMWKNSCCRNG